jgi:hypothetical protein
MQTTALDTPSARRNFWLVLLLILFAFSIHYAIAKAADGQSAILRWQKQLLGLGEGINIAEHYAYPNPPIMAILLYPFALMPPMVMALTWFYLKMILALVSLYWVFRLVETPERPFPFLAQVLTVALVLRPILGDLEHGNVNLFILFLVLACLIAYSGKRDLLAGVLLGLAIGCKITPALFVPYFLWKRSWKVLAGTVVGVALFLYPGFVPAMILGPQQNHDHLVGWYNVMVQPFIVEGKVTSEQQNQSLPGLVVRLLTHSPSAGTWENDQYIPLAYHNVANLSIDSAKLLVKGAMLLFVLLVACTCWTSTKTRQGWQLTAEFAIVTLGMLLFSERTWKHHAVTLLVPFAVLAYCLVEGLPSRAQRWLVGATLAASMLLIALTSDGLMSKSLAKLSQVYGAYTIVFVLLCGVLGALLVRGRRGGEPGETPGTVAAR